MIFTWDEPKRRQNLEKHGLDFADFEDGFDMKGALILPANNRRIKLIGEFKGEVLVAAIAGRLGDEALALISMRRASKKERERYGW